MSLSSDAIISVLQTARGNRPYSLESTETEQSFNVALALLVELIASNDRIDRIERQLADLSGKSLDEVRRSASDAEAEQCRSSANEATIHRALRILIDPRPMVDYRPWHRGEAG